MSTQTYIAPTVQPKDRPPQKKKGKGRPGKGVVGKKGQTRPPDTPTDLEYIQLFNTCVVNKEKVGELDKVIDEKVLANRSRYDTVAAAMQGKNNVGMTRPALGGPSFFQPNDAYGPRPNTPGGQPGYQSFLTNLLQPKPAEAAFHLLRPDPFTPQPGSFDWRNPFGLGLRTPTDFLGSGGSRIPWYIIALIHYLECSSDFTKHLHNGDPLTGYTVRVPAKRPQVGHPPPFTWEESAVDAMEYKKFNKQQSWSLPFILRTLERYNGVGYFKYKRGNTPYLWSYSGHYTKGKYTADGKFSKEAVSAQAGAAVLMKRMEERGLISIPRF